jgi:hypothetical protein
MLNPVVNTDKHSCGLLQCRESGGRSLIQTDFSVKIFHSEFPPPTKSRTANSLQWLDGGTNGSGFVPRQGQGIYCPPNRPHRLSRLPIVVFRECRRLFSRGKSLQEVKFTARLH